MNDQELKLIFDNDRTPDAWPAAPDAVAGDSELDEFSDPVANSVNAGDDAGDDAVRAGSTDEGDAGENGREDDDFDGEAAAQDLAEGAANSDYNEFEVTSPDVTRLSGTDDTCNEFDDFEISPSPPSVPPKFAEARWMKGTTRGVRRPPPGDGNY